MNAKKVASMRQALVRDRRGSLVGSVGRLSRAQCRLALRVQEGPYGVLCQLVVVRHGHTDVLQVSRRVAEELAAAGFAVSVVE